MSTLVATTYTLRHAPTGKHYEFTPVGHDQGTVLITFYGDHIVRYEVPTSEARWLYKQLLTKQYTRID